MTSHSPEFTLPQEYERLNALITTLQNEQAKLGEQKVDEILVLLTEKANIIADMTKLADQRFAALESAGFEASEAGMQQWLAQHGTAQDKTLLADMLALATTAKELNRLNGLLIGRHMSHNQQMLDAIQNVVQGGKIYGPDGQSNVKTRGRQLGIG